MQKTAKQDQAQIGQRAAATQAQQITGISPYSGHQTGDTVDWWPNYGTVGSSSSIQWQDTTSAATYTSASSVLS